MQAIQTNQYLGSSSKARVIYFLIGHTIKEALRTLWTCRQPAAVKRFFTRWYGRAVRSRLEPVKECGRHVETSSRRSRAYRAPVLILSPRRGPALYSVTVPSGFTTNSKGTDSYASNLV